MSKAEEMASIVRGWLDMLRNQQRIESARVALEKALTAAREEGRREGYERAREQAAQYTHKYVAALAKQALIPIMSDADALATGIRAMQDSAGEG